MRSDFVEQKDRRSAALRRDERRMCKDKRKQQRLLFTCPAAVGSLIICEIADDKGGTTGADPTMMIVGRRWRPGGAAGSAGSGMGC